MQIQHMSLPISTILAAAALVASQSAFAQGFLNKLAEKVQQKVTVPVGSAAGTTGGMSSVQPSAEEIRLANEDRADTSLDNRTFKADKRGVSGIYYPSVMLGAASMDREMIYAIGKVYLEFDDQKGLMTIYTRHAFETTNPTKLVPKGTWGETSAGNGRWLRGMLASNRLMLRTAGTDVTMNYKYRQPKYKLDLQNNEVPDGVMMQSLQAMFELEPGVIYVGDPAYGSSGGKPEGHNLLKSGMQLPVFYKAGKEEAAKAWTAERIVAAYKQVTDEIDKAGEDSDGKADPNLQLLPPHDQQLTKGESDGARAQWSRMIQTPDVANTQRSKRFTLSYLYATSPWAEMRKKQHVNNSYVDTIVSRSRVVAAVFQDQEGNHWTNRFYLVEKAPAGVYFGERWSGDYDFALAASSIPKGIVADAARKYQNAAKGK